MTKFKIKVVLSKGISVDLESDNPDIKKLVEKAVLNQKVIKPDNIKIDCKEKDFDNEGFKKIVVDLITKLLDEIKINDDGLKEVLKENEEKQ